MPVSVGFNQFRIRYDSGVNDFSRGVCQPHLIGGDVVKETIRRVQFQDCAGAAAGTLTQGHVSEIFHHGGEQVSAGVGFPAGQHRKVQIIADIRVRFIEFPVKVPVDEKTLVDILLLQDILVFQHTFP